MQVIIQNNDFEKLKTL